jgi:hypothetical protein
MKNQLNMLTLYYHVITGTTTVVAFRRGVTGRDGNGQGRVRVKHLPTRWHTRLSLLYPYPPNVMGKNPYPYPYPQGTRRVKGYPMGININMSLSSYIRVQ